MQSVLLISRTLFSSVNGCYKVVSSNLNWTEAALECRRLHKYAHLLVVNDAQEQSAVADMLSYTNRQYHYLLFFTVSLTVEGYEL